MGKRIEDLRKLDDSPIEHQVEALEAKRGKSASPTTATNPGTSSSARSTTCSRPATTTGPYDTLDGIRETVRADRGASPRPSSARSRTSRRGRRAAEPRRYEGYEAAGR